MLPAAEVVVSARDCELPESEKHVILVVFRQVRWQGCGKGRILSLCTRVGNEVIVNRHERTAKTTSDLRFSRVARVRLLEHVRHISTASMEEIAVVDAKETLLPTADTQKNDRAFGWQACRNALLHGTPEGINGFPIDTPTPTPSHACCT